MYILFVDGRVGKVKEVCMCAECIKRGEPEIFADDLAGDYLDCIKFRDLFDKNIIKALGFECEDFE